MTREAHHRNMHLKNNKKYKLKKSENKEKNESKILKKSFNIKRMLGFELLLYL